MKRLLIVCAVVMAVMFVPTVVAQAASPFAGACTAGGRDSAVCKTAEGDPLTTKTGIIHRVTLLVAVVAGFASVIVIIVGGIRYIAAGGNAEQVSKAKRTIIYATIGLVVIVLGQGIITFVIGGI